MPYIGKSPQFGVRNRFVYVASSGATSVSGADANGATLTFTDGAFVDVYLNGVLLKPTTDYNTSTANTIAGLSALNTSDEVTVVVYDVFTVADAVSATSGGTFVGNVTFNGDIDVDGTANLDVVDIDAKTTITAADGVVDNDYVVEIQNAEATDGRSYGVRIKAGSTSADQSFVIQDHDASNTLFKITGDGDVNIGIGDILFGTAGKGINLGVTSNTDSNTLDDYEEGTWTPRLHGTTTGDGTAASRIDANGAFDYYKIGRFVFVNWYFVNQNTSTQMTGNFTLGGLPFTSNGNYVSNNSLTYNMGHPSNIEGYSMRGVTAGNTVITFLNPRDNTSWAALDAADVVPNSTGIFFQGSLCYATDS